MGIEVHPEKTGTDPVVICDAQACGRRSPGSVQIYAHVNQRTIADARQLSQEKMREMVADAKNRIKGAPHAKRNGW